ncbi:hypothetical protein F8M41_014474 [Gigaspora margarita]|uniref:Uncharacterized protein n=1 Tax=Gigaspora margarita TaxID=4874 RepID=A0A8H3WWK2_GIGMA|nr:hypothetical protein F8M41_014474 [Gigaspora margarita]
MVDSTENEIEPYIIIDNIISESILNTSELTKITNKVENETILKPVQTKNDESEVKVDIDKNFEKDINLNKEIKFDLSAAQLEDQSGLISTVSASASDKILNNNNNIKLSDDKPHLSESKDLLDVNNELEESSLEESSLLSESYFLDFKSTESFNDFNNSDNIDDTEDFTFSESDAEGFDNVSTDNDDDYDVVSLDGNEIHLV